MKKWVSVEEAAALTQRSHHTIYNWVYKSRQKESSGPLILKRRPAPGSGKSNAWLIESSTLMAADKLSPRLWRLAKPNSTSWRVKKAFVLMAATVRNG